MDKGDFEGREALAKQQEEGLKTKLVLLDIDTTDVDAANGMEPVYADGKVVGQCSSGGFGHWTLDTGHWTQKSLALAYIDVDALASDLTVKILGNDYSATVTKGCIYDAKGALLKADD
ncbi:aminomethyl transferase family protein [Amphritea opalescens]|uniref:Aminomethyl transferase family protein n=1 Tax=Amphritea opalescens TaxID=2490544 RepID=A0A430KP40_9GAMM|nr:glycine cleavage T C-terminal barrel domain-containing protein [Amphritea opalescens]RTE65123.1 aminomethyl transferase family protein [Amphritea opalescens]